MNSATEVNIRRLHLRAPRAQRPRATTSLHTALWPQAAFDEWYFVRRIKVRATPPRLGPAAAANARAQVVAAVDGESPGARHASAVRFVSLARLLASLTTDLLSGRAAHVWYWRRWSHLFAVPPSEAIVRLWGDHVVELAEVTALLDACGQLRRVWSALHASDAKRLLQSLVQELTLAPAVAPEVDPRIVEPTLNHRAASVLDVPTVYRMRWHHALAAFPEGDPRTRLAACLVALEWRPAMLLDTFAGSLVGALVAALRGEARATLSPDVVARSAARRADAVRYVDRSPPRPPPPEHIDWSSASNIPAERTARDGRARADTRASSKQARPGIVPSPAAPRAPGLAARFELPDNDIELDHDGRAVTPAGVFDELPGGFNGLHTCEGGLFLLLNFVLRPEAQALIARHGGMTALPGGWAWLYRLGMALGLAEKGPLARWLAHVMGLDDVAGLTDLPLLPGGSALAALGARLYDGDGVHGPLWGEQLLARPALVSCTRSHLDICYPQEYASLAVRLAGLDLDPGWVPWLGRVVAFHYVHSPLFEQWEPA